MCSKQGASLFRGLLFTMTSCYLWLPRQQCAHGGMGVRNNTGATQNDMSPSQLNRKLYRLPKFYTSAASNGSLWRLSL